MLTISIQCVGFLIGIYLSKVIIDFSEYIETKRFIKSCGPCDIRFATQKEVELGSE